MAFSLSSRNVTLDGSTLKAECRDTEGAYHDAVIELDHYIMNENGVLKWHPNGYFGKSSRNLSLEGETSSILKAESEDMQGSWLSAQIDLDEKITNCGGRLLYVFDRAILKVDERNADQVATYLSNFYEANKEEVSASVSQDGNSKVLYVGARAGKDEGVILQISAEAEATIFRVVGEHGGMQTVSASVLQAKAKTWTSQVGAGVGISANLIDAKASVFDLTLGVGIDTGIGIKDDSFSFELLGCGFTLGRRVEISVLGSSFGVDFGRCSVM